MQPQSTQVSAFNAAQFQPTIKAAGQSLPDDFFEVGKIYALPALNRYGNVKHQYFVYQGRETPESDNNEASGKYTFIGQFDGLEKIFSLKELLKMEIEKLPDGQEISKKDGESTLAMNKNIKYDGDDIPEGFFVIKAEYNISSRQHAGSSRIDSFPSMKKMCFFRV